MAAGAFETIPLYAQSVDLHCVESFQNESESAGAAGCSTWRAAGVVERPVAQPNGHIGPEPRGLLLDEN